MNIFVGNLSYSTNEESLQTLFQAHGAVTSVKVIRDKETGQSRGFAFVEMANPAEAKAAMTALDGKELDGRNLKVNEARPKNEGGGSGGFRGGDRGGDRGGFRGSPGGPRGGDRGGDRGNRSGPREQRW